MGCQDKEFENANDPDGCKCQMAVMRAYEGMKHEGDKIALGVAVRVYNFHHPEDALADATLTVSRWIHEGHFH